jgi:membrane protein implicated in regulation of membrane protease activity
MEWWVWLLLGLLLFIAEYVVGSDFYLMFFGASSTVVAALTAVGLSGPLWTQVLLFCLLSFAGVFVLRRLIMTRTTTDLDGLVGKTAIALEDLSEDAVGKVEMRGTTWKAINIGPTVVRKGQRCQVHEVKSITLLIRGE